MKKKFITLLGLPRSGTTMVTAMFDVHPNIAAWFEPWNARKNKNPQPYQSVEDFILQYKNSFNIDVSNKRGLMFKETTTHLEAIEWSKNSLENIKKSNPEYDIKLIWLVRDINHAYLSKIHTARKHWGHKDMQIDTETFKHFINIAFKGFESIEEVIKSYDSCILSYEKIVTEPKETMQKVMDFIGMKLHPRQLEYYKHFKTNKSAGDPEVSSSPKPIDPEKIYNRDKEWKQYESEFVNALNSEEKKKYDYMMNIVNKVRQNGFIKYKKEK